MYCLDATRCIADSVAIYDDCIRKIITSGKYRSFLYEDDNFYMTAPDSCLAMVKAGKVLSNCLADYIEKFAAGKSFIYFLRMKCRPEEVYYVCEISPVSDSYGILKQAYAADNSIEKTEECRIFFISWLITKKSGLTPYVKCRTTYS